MCLLIQENSRVSFLPRANLQFNTSLLYSLFCYLVALPKIGHHIVISSKDHVTVYENVIQEELHNGMDGVIMRPQIIMVHVVCFWFPVQIRICHRVHM